MSKQKSNYDLETVEINLQKLNFLHNLTNEKLIDLAFTGNNYIERYEAMKTVINRNLISFELICKFIEENSGEHYYRIFEFIKDVDLLTSINVFLENSRKSVDVIDYIIKAKKIINLRLNDLDLISRFMNVQNNDLKTRLQTVPMLSLPNSYIEIIKSDIDVRVKESALEHLHFTATDTYEYISLFDESYVYELFQEIGFSTLTDRIRTIALIKIKELKPNEFLYAYENFEELKDSLKYHASKM